VYSVTIFTYFLCVLFVRFYITLGMMFRRWQMEQQMHTRRNKRALNKPTAWLSMVVYPLQNVRSCTVELETGPLTLRGIANESCRI